MERCNRCEYEATTGPLIILMVTAASKFLDFISGLFKWQTQLDCSPLWSMAKIEVDIYAHLPI